jgi:hypothetical protein
MKLVKEYLDCIDRVSALVYGLGIRNGLYETIQRQGIKIIVTRATLHRLAAQHSHLLALHSHGG